MKSITLVALSIAILSGCISNTKTNAPALPTSLEEAVNSEYRTPKNKERDIYRHPGETLAFFGLKPNMTVVEISPGGGWYMEILAPYLATEGKYIASIFPEGGRPYMTEMNSKIMEWLNRYPLIKEKTTLTTFSSPKHLDIAPEGSADMVLTFRNVHNWTANKGGDDAFRAFYKALKPGGILGVVEHRASPKVKKDPAYKSGYVHEKEVIRMAEKAGFKLEAKSEINANPKDTKSHPEGVWTLPPVLRLGEKDKEKYMAIGESDRMTLKFVKPLK